MRNAKIAAAITAAVAAVLTVLGKAFNFGVDTTTQILVRFGYDWGQAAARAPFYFSISIGLTGILACIGWIISEDGYSTARSIPTENVRCWMPKPKPPRKRKPAKANGGADR